MKISIKKLISAGLTVIMTVIIACVAFGCDDGETDGPPIIPEPPTPQSPQLTDEDYLKVSGDKIKKNYGSGEEVVLRGTNAGGYLVIESWMNAVNSSDHKTATENFVERFGEEQTLELWDYYRTQYWTEQDFQNCADMGLNVIRLPFSYMNVDTEYNNVAPIEGEKYNFSLLDDFIEKAASYGLYTILDMHGAYGSQNGQDHSGETIKLAEDVDFYSNMTNRNKTLALWVALARRYAENPAVAGYDLLNEPGEKGGLTNSVHWGYFDELYKEIRLVDKNHIVIFESCWEGKDMPKTSRYGWTNCIYSFHHYTSYDDKTHIQSFTDRVDEISSHNFGIPIYMGEFTCYSDQDDWRETLDLLNGKNWSWTPWTYKRNLRNNNNPTSSDGWGIYHTRAQQVNPKTDTIEQIKEKWDLVRTDCIATSLQTFASGATLSQVLKIACE